MVMNINVAVIRLLLMMMVTLISARSQSYHPVIVDLSQGSLLLLHYSDAYWGSFGTIVEEESK
jgi:hypothetical protein